MDTKYDAPSPMAGGIRARLRLTTAIAPSMALPAVIDLTDQLVVTFGRAKENNVILDSTRVAQQISRMHARIVAGGDGQTFTLIDQNSKNGVFVNDRRIEAASLVPGDIIVFGGATPTTKVGDLLPQPLSEFRYTFEIEKPQPPVGGDAGKAGGSGGGGGGGGDEGVVESTFASMKALTENITVVFTWVSSLAIGSSYLFADEGSDEFSYMQTYVKPVFDVVGVRFTRTTFTLSIVLAGVLAMAAIHFLRTRRPPPTPVPAPASLPPR